MKLTQDEIVVLIESLREYRLRLGEGARRIVCEALVYRLYKELADLDKQDLTNGE